MPECAEAYFRNLEFQNFPVEEPLYPRFSGKGKRKGNEGMENLGMWKMGRGWRERKERERGM